MTKRSVPTYDALMNPLLKAMQLLGGSGSIEEINSKVAEIARIPDEQLDILHNPKKGGMTEIEYRLGWTRTYLKKYGVLENSVKGVWALTPEWRKIERVDEKDVVRTVRKRMKQEKEAQILEKPGVPDTEINWREELIDLLLKMEPSSFERLIQRVLRESGFIQVEVTGRTGDGGIDGRGILRLGGFLSFHVIFQAKRWQGAVGARPIRDFRGAMVGRADKGLFITTGTFTKDAIREATRDGAPAIDLIDGEQILEKLKELTLGVQTRKVEKEQVSIDRDWFSTI